jgi:glyoxylase I family protein
MIEIYNNPKAPVPNYASLSALVLHVAFTVDDINETRERLVKGGATRDGDTALNDDGDELAMVRDPWGFPLQLVKRKKPLM